MDHLTAASQSPSPEQVIEESQNPLQAAPTPCEPNGDLSDHIYPPIANLRLSSGRPRNEDGLTEVLTARNSVSSGSATPPSSSKGNLPLDSTGPGVVSRQEPDTYSSSSVRSTRASFQAAEHVICSKSRESHDSAPIGVDGCPTVFRENTCLSPKDVLPNETGDEDKLEAQAHRTEVFKRGFGGYLGGQGEGVGLGATTVFPMRQVSFNRNQFPKVATNESGRASRRGEYTEQARYRRSLSRAAESEMDEEGPPNMRLVHDVVDNLIEEFESRPIFPVPSRQPSSLRSSRFPVQSPRGRSPGMTLSTPLLGRGRGARLSSAFGTKRGSMSPRSAVGARSEASPPDKASDRNKVIERVLTTCSLLESITGEVTTEARKLYESQSQLPTSKNKPETVSLMAVSHKEGEAGSNYKILNERGTPAESGSTGTAPPEPERPLSPKARKAKLAGKPAKMPKDEELPIRSPRSYSQKKLKLDETADPGVHKAGFKYPEDHMEAEINVYDSPTAEEGQGFYGINALAGSPNPPSGKLTRAPKKKAAAEKRSQKALSSDGKSEKNKEGGGRNADAARVRFPDVEASATADGNGAWASAAIKGLDRRKAVARSKKSDGHPPDPEKGAAAKKGSKKARSKELKAATDDRGGQHLDAKRVPYQSTSSNSPVDSVDAKPSNASTPRVRKKNAARSNKMGVVDAALKAPPEAPAAGGAKQALRNRRKEAKKDSGRWFNPLGILSPGTESQDSAESDDVTPLNVLADTSPLSPSKSPSTKGYKKGKQKASKKDKERRVGAAKALSPEPGSADSIESNDATPLIKSPLSPSKSPSAKGRKASKTDKKRRAEVAKTLSSEPSSEGSIESGDATPSKKSKGSQSKKSGVSSKKKENAELSPVVPKKASAKKKSAKVPSSGRKPPKDKATADLEVDAAEADDPEVSDEDSADNDDQLINESTSDDKEPTKLKRSSSQKGHLRSSAKAETRDKKPLRPVETKSLKKVAEQQQREGNSRDSKAGRPGVASGRISTTGPEATANVGDKEIESTNWRSKAAYEDKPEGKSLKVQASERGPEIRRSSTRRMLETEPAGLKPKAMSAQADARDDREVHLEISVYESFSTEDEYYLSDKKFSLGAPKLHKNQRSVPAQGGRLCSDNAKSRVFLVDRCVVGERVAPRKSSLPINDEKKWTKTEARRRLSRTLDQAEEHDRPWFRARIGRGALPHDPAGEDGGQRVVTARIGHRSSPSRTSASLAQVDSDTHTKGSGTGVVLASRSLNYGLKRLNRSVSVEWKIPQSWSIEHCVPEGRQTPYGRVTEPGPRRFDCHEGRPRSHSVQGFAKNVSPLFHGASRSRMSRTMPLGRPALASLLYARKPFPRPRFPWPSPSPQYQAATTGVVRQGSFSVKRRLQPPAAFRQCRGSGAEVVVSLHGASQQAMPLEAHGAPIKTIETFQGASLSGISGTEVSPPKAKIVFRGTSTENPSAPVRGPSVAVAPKTTINALPPEPTAIQGAAPEHTTTQTTGAKDQQDQARTTTSIEIKRNATSQSIDVFHSLRDSEQSSTLSFDANLSSGIQIDLTCEGENAKPTAFGSTNAIVPTGEDRLPGGFGNKFHQPTSTVLFIILAVAALTGIGAGFVVYLGRYAASSLLSDITDRESDVTGGHAGPWVFSPRFKANASVSPKRECNNPWCSNQLAALIRSLDAGVRPCENFYGHVCARLRLGNATAAGKLVQPTAERMATFLGGIGRPGREAQVVAASRRLWKDCVDLATLNRLGKVPLQDLLNRTGLSGWPYNGADALPDVWEAAGKLQRLMDLAPLVEVNVRPDNTLRLSHGYRNGTVGVDNVLDAMLTLRRDTSLLRQLAEDVAAFGYQMDGLLNSHEPLISHHQLSDADLVLRPFLQIALEGLRSDAGAVRTELENFIDPLVQLVRDTRPETVLNLLGYRLVRHVGLFTPSPVKADLASAELSRR